MLRFGVRALVAIAVAAPFILFARRPNDAAAGRVPAPRLASGETATALQTVVLAGGCFWGVEAVYEHIKGVTRVTSGYTGGSANTADYESVSAGDTGHAESVRITYDPSRITYGRLLKVF